MKHGWTSDLHYDIFDGADFPKAYVTDQIAKETYEADHIWSQTVDTTLESIVSVDEVRLRVGSKLFKHIDKIMAERMKGKGIYSKRYNYPLMISYDTLKHIHFCELVDSSLILRRPLKSGVVNIKVKLINNIEYLKLLDEKKNEPGSKR